MVDDYPFAAGQKNGQTPAPKIAEQKKPGKPPGFQDRCS